jgi:hypothetical protein
MGTDCQLSEIQECKENETLEDTKELIKKYKNIQYNGLKKKDERNSNSQHQW